MFLKIKTNDSRNKVLAEKINPYHVVDVVTDARDIVREIRIEIPLENDKYYLEYWQDVGEGGGYVVVFNDIQNPAGKEISELNTPSYSASFADLGISFIPIVYIRFTNQNKRAVSCFSHALLKIIEADRKTTRFSEILYAYNIPYWNIITTSVDKVGYVKWLTPEVKLLSNTDGTAKFQYLKGGYALESSIPNVNYEAMIKGIELSKTILEEALPELRANSLESTQLSGRALVTLLGEAVARGRTARANMLQGLQRVGEMCLTVGQVRGIFDASVGEYDENFYRHSIKCDDIVQQSPEDKSLLIQQLTSSGVPLKSALRMAEFNEEEINLIMQEKQQETLSLMDSVLSNANFKGDVNSKTGG